MRRKTRWTDIYEEADMFFFMSEEGNEKLRGLDINIYLFN
jgi:hypothetical protein